MLVMVIIEDVLQSLQKLDANVDSFVETSLVNQAEHCQASILFKVWLKKYY